MSRVFFNPFTILALFFLIGVIIVVVPLLLLSLIGTAFVKLGFSWMQVLLILLATLVGSFVNIPLTTIRNRHALTEEVFDPWFGRVYRIQSVSPTTTIAVNVGGALIPICISVILVLTAVREESNTSPILLSCIGILAVALVTKLLARPVRGIGITMPFFVSPLAAALAGLALAGCPCIDAAVIAYTSGTIGTLIGADIANLHRIPHIGASVVSIGGAGTFDGIFLSGVIAAILA
jgi:uncharacterized membrane protein